MQSKMRNVLITRMVDESDRFGTFGKLTTDSGFQCYSGELQWKDNKPDISCIPAGVYQCAMRKSVKHGNCYGVEGVQGRTNIEIHSGNFCGDSSQGLKDDVLGCIILGDAIGEIAGQKALLSSKDALTRFEADLEGSAFRLSIGWE